MAVYVDKSKNQFGRMKMCHMLADSIDELHSFAKKIGMKREWYQPKSTPHYDLSKSRRLLALKNGAIEIGPEEVVEIIHKYRDGSFCSRCGHSQARHMTIGGFCKHCSCDEFIE